MTTRTPHELPELPDPYMTTESGLPLFHDIQMRAYAHEAISKFLADTGQYVTNDASREAAITNAIEKARVK